MEVYCVLPQVCACLTEFCITTRFSGTEVVRLTASLLALDDATFVQMARHPVGSHVLEGLLTCDISVKKKTKLLGKFKGSFTSLAMDKFGSHVVDKCWSQADIKTKEWYCVRCTCAFCYVLFRRNTKHDHSVDIAYEGL